MEDARRELASVLLDHIRSLGLISDFTYSRAMDLVHSGADLPEFFQDLAPTTEEAGGYEPAQDAQRASKWEDHL